MDQRPKSANYHRYEFSAAAASTLNDERTAAKDFFFATFVPPSFRPLSRWAPKLFSHQGSVLPQACPCIGCYHVSSQRIHRVCFIADSYKGHFGDWLKFWGKIGPQILLGTLSQCRSHDCSLHSAESCLFNTNTGSTIVRQGNLPRFSFRTKPTMRKG